MPATSADHAGHAPHDHPNAVERNANRLRRLVVVGHCPQGPAGAGFLEEQGQQGHQGGGNDRGDQVFLVDQNAPFKGISNKNTGSLGMPMSIL
jgi:hypothetical protein